MSESALDAARRAAREARHTANPVVTSTDLVGSLLDTMADSPANQVERELQTSSLDAVQAVVVKRLLDVEASGGGGSPSLPLDLGPGLFQIAADGTVNITPSDTSFGEYGLHIDVQGIPGANAVQIEGNDSTGPLLTVHDNTNFLDVFSADSASVTMANVFITNQLYDSTQLTIRGKSGGSVPIMVVKDASNATVFQIDANGSIHIQTGATIIADL